MGWNLDLTHHYPHIQSYHCCAFFLVGIVKVALVVLVDVVCESLPRVSYVFITWDEGGIFSRRNNFSPIEVNLCTDFGLFFFDFSFCIRRPLWVVMSSFENLNIEYISVSKFGLFLSASRYFTIFITSYRP